MHYAVLSDVHANLEALDAVLNDIRQRRIRDILFIGDAVGYGPNPGECVELLAGSCKALLAGNHDWGVLGLKDVAYFNEYARSAIEWTAGVMTEKTKDILRTFPVRKEYKHEDMLLVHATPHEPEAWHYLFTLGDAEFSFRHFDNRFCFLGHSHKPFIIEKGPSGDLMMHEKKTLIKEGCRYIINAGSVGQPRDGDPRASYAAINDEELAIVRIPYDIERVQRKMREEHLPDLLLERLSEGR